MTKEHVEALKAKYPELLQGLRSGEPECGDGWYALIDAALQALAVSGSTPYPNDFVIIKEKFGQLRMQGFHDPKGVLNAYEQQSDEICYDCGKPATTVKGFYALCVRCVRTAR